MSKLDLLFGSAIVAALILLALAILARQQGRALWYLVASWTISLVTGVVTVWSFGPVQPWFATMFWWLPATFYLLIAVATLVSLGLYFYSMDHDYLWLARISSAVFAAYIAIIGGGTLYILVTEISEALST